jgi:hypothetical protein
MALISLPQPSLALNAWNMTGIGFPRYKMDYSWMLDANDTVEGIADRAAEAARGASGGKFKSVVINSHGSCGRARLSVPAVLDASTAGKFAPLKGLAGHIIITACSVIGVAPGGAGFWNDAGVRMAYGLARATGARVYASNEEQHMDVSYFLFSTLFGGEGDIDDLEGNVLMMPPSGIAAWLGSNTAVGQMVRSL